jgi:prepilin-type N-terminal cleavage/methylation domain-containing protein
LTDVAAASRVSDLHPSSFILPPSLPPRRLAFTLTELLVVIAIIAVLAAMVSVGVMRALDTAKQTRIKTEVDQLDAAFKAYRDKYGSFPPSDLSQMAGSSKLVQHLARAFPRYTATGTMLRDELIAAGLDANSLRPDHALVFWLKGFSPDPAHPFVTVDGFQIMNGAATTTKVQVTPLFDFDKTRLASVPATPTRMPSYFPQGTKADATGAPYIYWDSQSPPAGGGAVNPPYPLPPTAVMWNIAGPPMFNSVIFPNAGGIRPYAFDADGNGSLDFDSDGVMDPGDGWANPDSFQIISAGLDGKYGSLTAARTDHARIYPTGIPSRGASDPSVTTYDPLGGDDDNVTNFSPKARLGDAKP